MAQPCDGMANTYKTIDVAVKHIKTSVKLELVFTDMTSLTVSILILKRLCVVLI